MTGVITILAAGTGTGPFYIYSNVDGFTVPFASNISKAALLAGYPTDQIPFGTTIIRVKSLNDVCNNYVDIVVPPQTCYNFLPENTTYILSQVNKSTNGYFYGYFTGYEETGIPTSSKHLVKLNEDLTIDDTFDVGVGFDEILYTGSSIIEQPDGKIIATGTFTTYQGVSANRIIRLNTDGTRDNTFVIGTGFNDFTQVPRFDSTYKILVTGIYSEYDGYAANRLIRLNTDGSVDTTLVIGTGFNNTTVDVLTNPDDSMIVTGYFTAYNGSTREGMVKLDSLGAVDVTFVVGTGLVPHGNLEPTYLSRIAEESSFYATGYFTEYKGVPEPYIIKIDEFGNKDTSFDAGTGFDGVTYFIQTVWDNKLLVLGDYENYNGTSAYSGFILLNADGTVLYSEESLTYYNTPIIIGNNLFASPTGGCMELLYTFVPVAPTTTTTTTVAPTTTTTTSCIPLFCDYGLLYNWHAVNTGKLAPTDWRVPTLTDFQTLRLYVASQGWNYDGSITAGTDTNNKQGKALSSDCGWTYSATIGAVGNTDYSAIRNISGLTIYPQGDRGATGIFEVINSASLLWSSSIGGIVTNAYSLLLYNTATYSFINGNYNQKRGHGVRCVRDTYIGWEADVPVIDYDGNEYDVIEIGTQLWLIQNLKVVHYNDGEIIPNITDNTIWSSLTTGALCAYNNNWGTYPCIPEPTTTTTTTVSPTTTTTTTLTDTFIFTSSCDSGGGAGGACCAVGVYPETFYCGDNPIVLTSIIYSDAVGGTPVVGANLWYKEQITQEVYRIDNTGVVIEVYSLC